MSVNYLSKTASREEIIDTINAVIAYMNDFMKLDNLTDEEVKEIIEHYKLDPKLIEE